MTKVHFTKILSTASIVLAILSIGSYANADDIDEFTETYTIRFDNDNTSTTTERFIIKDTNTNIFTANFTSTNITTGTGNATLSVSDTSSSLLVESEEGNAHGITISPTQTVISGGTTSSTMTLNDNGASFASTSGGPVRVTGVADGVNPYDAVNYRQFNKAIEEVQGGVASTAAMSNIPQVEPGKKFSLGLGYGHFASQHATAIGASARVTDQAIVKASFGASTEGDTTVGVGAAYSW